MQHTQFSKCTCMFLFSAPFNYEWMKGKYMHKSIKQVFSYEKWGMKQQFLLGKWRMELQFSYKKQGMKQQFPFWKHNWSNAKINYFEFDLPMIKKTGNETLNKLLFKGGRTGKFTSL